MDQTLTKAVKHHDIKILPQFFEDTSCGRKSFELRKDDRDYQIGDTVTMHEWTPDAGYTGRQLMITIIYVLRGCPEYGLMDGYCILGWIPGEAPNQEHMGETEEVKWLSWKNGKEWCKVQCPMFGDKYIMTYYPEDVPCYYSYTAPFVCDEEVCYYRFDHDEGCWDEDILFHLGKYKEGMICEFG